MSVYGVNKEPTAPASTPSRIVAAATEILIAEGAGAVSMRRVGTAIGMTPMAIYRHFENRDALLDEVAARAFRDIARRWTETVRTGSLDQRMFAALDDYLDFALSEPRLYEFVFGDPRAGARTYAVEMRAGQSITLNVLAELLTEGMDSGEFRRDDVWEVAITIAAFLHGFVQLHHGGRIGLPDDQFRALCHSSVRRLFDGIRA